MTSNKSTVVLLLAIGEGGCVFVGRGVREAQKDSGVMKEERGGGKQRVRAI
jgi:hypothetical protein